KTRPKRGRVSGKARAATPGTSSPPVNRALFDESSAHRLGGDQDELVPDQLVEIYAQGCRDGLRVPEIDRSGKQPARVVSVAPRSNTPVSGGPQDRLQIRMLTELTEQDGPCMARLPQNHGGHRRSDSPADQHS